MKFVFQCGHTISLKIQSQLSSELRSSRTRNSGQIQLKTKCIINAKKPIILNQTQI